MPRERWDPDLRLFTVEASAESWTNRVCMVGRNFSRFNIYFDSPAHLWVPSKRPGCLTYAHANTSNDLHDLHIHWHCSWESWSHLGTNFATRMTPRSLTRHFSRADLQSPGVLWFIHTSRLALLPHEALGASLATSANRFAYGSSHGEISNTSAS